MDNLVIAKYNAKPAIITNGMLVYVTSKGMNPRNDEFYIISVCPNPDHVSTATLVLTNLSCGRVYNVYTIKASFNHTKGMFEVTREEFEKYIGPIMTWGIVNSVTITRE